MIKLIFKKYVRIIFFCCLIMLSVSFTTEASEVMRCNVNSECREGFVCVGGIGSNVDTDQKTGCCEVILPIRQVCLFHNLITGKLGIAIVSFVVICIGMMTMFGKLNLRVLITFFVGTVCLFGSYQVVYLTTGYNYRMCELVDTSITPGDCPSPNAN